MNPHINSKWGKNNFPHFYPSNHCAITRAIHLRFPYPRTIRAQYWFENRISLEKFWKKSRISRKINFREIEEPKISKYSDAKIQNGSYLWLRVCRQSAVERRESCQRRTDDRQTDHQFFTARRSALIVEWLLSPLLPFPQKLNFPRSQTFHLREFPRSGSRSGNCFSMTSFRTIVSQFLPLFNRPRRDSTWFATRMRPSNIFSKLDQTFPYTLVPSVQSVSKKSLSLSLHFRLPSSFLAATSVFFDGLRTAAEKEINRERDRENGFSLRVVHGRIVLFADNGHRRR